MTGTGMAETAVWSTAADAGASDVGVRLSDRSVAADLPAPRDDGRAATLCPVTDEGLDVAVGIGVDLIGDVEDDEGIGVVNGTGCDVAETARGGFSG
jgi:hypothetical protein